MKKQTRHEARIAVFTQVFQMNEHTTAEEVEFSLETLFEEQPECEDNKEYIRNTVNGVYGMYSELTCIISDHLKASWKLSRISRISRSLMTLAIYEMKYVDDVPARSAINEAVKIAKEYGEENDHVFINGLLASVYKEAEGKNEG